MRPPPAVTVLPDQTLFVQRFGNTFVDRDEPDRIVAGPKRQPSGQHAGPVRLELQPVAVFEPTQQATLPMSEPIRHIRLKLVYGTAPGTDG